MTTRSDAPPRTAYRIAEVAASLGISDWSVREAIKRGEIPAERIGQNVLIPAWWLDARRQPQAPPA